MTTVENFLEEINIMVDAMHHADTHNAFTDQLDIICLQLYTLEYPDQYADKKRESILKWRNDLVQYSSFKFTQGHNLRSHKLTSETKTLMVCFVGGSTLPYQRMVERIGGWKEKISA